MKLTEINRYLKVNSEFTSHVESLGFSKGPGTLWYYRCRDPYIDVFAFWVSSSGNFLDIPVVCFKRELVDHCDMTKFPKGFASGMPILSESYISKSSKGVEWSKSPWKIADEKQLKDTLEALIEKIDGKVNSWFLNVDSDKKFFETFPPYAQEDEYGLEIKSKLNI